MFNVEKYLHECIDSVIHQTYPYIKIILVDDGSTDSSGKICDEYSRIDPRITVIHKPNGGLSDARNAGLSQADTKYIYFLDSDDYIEPETIEILHALSEQNNLDVIAFDSTVFIERGFRYSAAPDYYIRKNSYAETMSGYKLYSLFLRNKEYRSPVQLYFYNKNFLDENGLTFRKGIIHEDELFTFIALLSAERTMHIPALLYNRRYRADSIMTKRVTQRNSDGMFVVLQEALKMYKKFHGRPETRQIYDLGIQYFIRSYSGRYTASFRLQDEKGHKQFETMMKELKSLGYNTSGMKRRVKLRYLYYIKSSVGKISWLKTGLKKCYALAKRSAKKFILYFRPKLDDECKSIIQRLKETNNTNFKRIITLCVPRHGNRGDIAIALAQRRLFTDKCPEYVLIEIPGDMCSFYSRLIIPHLNKRDILITNGGGWFGSLWRHNETAVLKIFRHFRDNRIIVMPQTVYYSDNVMGRLELAQDRRSFVKFTDFHVFVRDRTSHELIHRTDLYPNAKTVEHVPDMVCSMDFQNLESEKRSGVLVCLRADVERVLDKKEQNALYAKLIREYGNLGFFSTNPPQSSVKIHVWEEELIKSLKTVAGAELLVTDRLHGMLFAAVTGTPCVAFNNRTGKVHSVYEWIEDCGYVQVCNSLYEFDEALSRAVNSPHKWDNSNLMPYFSKITALISEKE